MDHTPITLAPARWVAGTHPDALGVYAGAGRAVAVAGAQGLWMAVAETTLGPRDRIVGVLGSAATIAVGAAGTRRPDVLADAVRGPLPAPVLPGLAIAAVAASRPERSPLLIPSIVLTALGTGNTGERGGLVVGAGTAVAYLGAVGVGARAWRHPDRHLWWNAGTASAFVVAGLVGSTVGDIALGARALERLHGRRASAGIAAPLADLVTRAAAIASEVDDLLAAMDRPRDVEEVGDDDTLRQAVRESRRLAIHHRLSPLLVAAAHDRPLALSETVGTMVAAYRAAWAEKDVRVTVRDRSGDGAAVSAAATAALIHVLKVALDNCAAHEVSPLADVRVRIDGTAEALVVTVEDDAGGAVPARATWGTGLTESAALLDAVGGGLELERGRAGVRVVATVPRRDGTPAGRPLPRGVVDRMDTDLAMIARQLRRANVLMGATGLLTGRDRQERRACLVLFLAGAAFDGVRGPAPGRSRDAPALHGTLVALAGLWPADGRPPSGTMGAALFLDGFLNGSRVLGPTGAAAGALVASARRVRGSVDRGRRAENVVFPPLCAAIGLAAGRGRRALQVAEARVQSGRARSRLVEQIAYTARLHHNIIKPLLAAPAWWDVVDGDAEQRLVRLSADLSSVLRELRARVVAADPLAELRDHLAAVLAPAEIIVEGDRPDRAGPGPRRSDDVVLERARQSLALTTAAEEIADEILAIHAPGPLGIWRLTRVRLLLRRDAADPGRTTIEVRTEPRRPGARRWENRTRLAAALDRVGGRAGPTVCDGGFTLSVPSDVLTP
ncbi:ATP-binding protein [Patulibacter minatonensis]|uniref:ATP-binding protein n=1 Tax=Patulibacter minatonensis TaxID=298163 RepID=UPI00047E744F|nr:ATP-binding protein [Patulibacter minatonensis]